MSNNGHDAALNPPAPSAAAPTAPSAPASASATATATATAPVQDPRPRPSSPPAPLPAARKRTASPPAARNPKRSPARSTAGNGPSEHGDAANESEAETVVLDPPSESSPREKKKVIKTERDDDDDHGARLRSIKEASRARSPQPNGRPSTAAATSAAAADDKERKPNGTGAKTSAHGHRDARSPLATSPASRTAARPAKDDSPSASSPQPARPRSASTADSRKRKLRDDSHTKALEPLRQKAKTEGPRDRDPRSNPDAPNTPALPRPHKRSQSTQSVAAGTAGRKRRELTALALTTERRHWSDSSSEHSSSPHPAETPGLLSHARTKRSTHRALESPARAMPKKNVDRFGATRLARESEKGELDAVRAAYEAAPEELDQADFAGITPLQKAALKGWLHVVKFLLEKGCRTDCMSDDRDTPLIDAVENGHLDVVKLLLHQGKVNPHHQNKKGQRAIDVLDPDEDDAEDIEKVLKEAMRRHADTSKEESSQPGLYQQTSASRLLYNEYNSETLIEKAGDGDIAAVGELINSNIKPNIACGVAASRGGHYDILSILLASGLKADPDPSKHSETPMLVAIGRGHTNIVQLLLENDSFNPSRRNREGKTYFEISEERRGPKWEYERNMLKEAYDNWLLTHRSPKRAKKEAPHPSAARKRKSSPRREHSSSPRPEAKRTQSGKSATSHAPQKARRLMSGKEMAQNKEIKRRRRVVSEDTSEDESAEEVRRPTKKVMSKARAHSDGDDTKPAPKSQPRSEAHDQLKRPKHAVSDESDEEVHVRQSKPKIRTKTEKIHQKPTPTPDAESHDERKAKKMIKPRTADDKIKKRRVSNVSMEDVLAMKKSHADSAKSTPAPPEKAATPEVVRERRQEAERQAVEAKRKAAEAEARKREEEAAARKAAEEEEARKRAEAEAEAKRKAEETKRREEETKRREELARRKAEEAEAARVKEEEEEARKRAEEEARRRAEEIKRQAEEESKRQAEETKRQEELAARQTRISKLPRALRRACELGSNRPLHFSGDEMGITAVYLPLFYATSNDLLPNEHQDAVSKLYIMSFQAVGILGLPELDLAHLEPPYSTWERHPVTLKQREMLLRQYDVALLAQDFRFPMEGTPEFDYAEIQASIKEARQQFLDMEGLYWIEDAALYPEMEKNEVLRPLLGEVKDVERRRQLHVREAEGESAPEHKCRPRKSFMDVVLGMNGMKKDEASGTNGNGNGNGSISVNGEG